jgi:hypothetical protein
MSAGQTQLAAQEIAEQEPRLDRALHPHPVDGDDDAPLPAHAQPSG